MCIRLVLLLTFLCLAVPTGWAGDEGVPVKPDLNAAPEVMEPETPPPEQPPEENPEPSMGEEETPPPPPPPPPPVQKRRPVRVVKRRPHWMNTNPDLNLDNSRVEGSVRRVSLPNGVLPPALGARGYRSTIIAVGAGDRTPGYGFLMEHSFDRMGLGFAASYLPLSGDLRARQYSFYSLYGSYRWLPYSMSPYLHGGIQYGLGTPIGFGLMGGVGIDTKVYEGLTLMVGYTFHSVAEKGYWGGAFGWAF